MNANRMNCKKAQSQIALWVGHDLDDSKHAEVEKHLAQCKTCRTYGDTFQQSFEALQLACEDCETPAQTSLWPSVAGRIAGLETRPRPPQLRRWAPVAAILAACLLVAIFSTPQLRVEYDSAMPNDPVIPTAPVAEHPYEVRPVPSAEETIIIADPEDQFSPFSLRDSFDNPTHFDLRPSRKRRKLTVPLVPVNQWKNDGF